MTSRTPSALTATLHSFREELKCQQMLANVNEHFVHIVWPKVPQQVNRQQFLPRQLDQLHIPSRFRDDAAHVYVVNPKQLYVL